MRKTTLGFVLIAIFVLLVCVMTACTPDLAKRGASQAKLGQLDLSGWRFSTDGAVALNGAWAFYWKAHLQPADFASSTAPVPTGYIQVPGIWNGYEVAGQPLAGDGYATYRLNVWLGHPRPRLALKILDMATAFVLYVNGHKRLSAGVPGLTSQTTLPGFDPQIVEIPEATDALDIVIQVSNYHHRKGGIWEAIQLGPVDTLRNSREQALMLNLGLFGSIVIMGLYHFGLFALRPRDLSTLYFGIFCLLIATRILTTGERYVIQLLPDFDWETLVKITYLTFYLAVPICAVFVRALFPQDLSRQVIGLVVAVSIPFVGLVLITPARVYTHTMLVFELFAMITFGYGLYALSLAVKRQRDGALVLLAGFVVLFLAALNDMLYANLIVHTGYVIQVGLFVFFLSQSLWLARRFSKAFSLVEHQRMVLTQTNQAYVQEISERERAEAALRQSESALAEAQRLAHIGNWSWNIRSGDVTGSEEMYRIFDLEAGPDRLVLSYDQMQAMTWPEDRTIWAQAMQAALDTNQPLRLDYRVQTATGEPRWVHSEAEVVRDERGAALKMFGTFQDITERKHMEAERLQSSKLESIGMLAGGIAHEFNNILTAILGFTQLTQYEVPRNSVLWSNMQEVLNAGGRAQALVQQLPTFSRWGGQSRTPVQVTQVVEEGLRLLRASLPAMIEIRTTFTTEDTMVSANRNQLHQVMLNLCANAEYVMRERGGILEIGVMLVSVDAIFAARYPALQPGPYVRVSVRDTGPGILPEVVDRIFEPFFTTKGVGEGTGMGLAIVQSIATSHSGTITVESIQGEGTTFALYLPRITEALPDTTDVVEVDMPRGTERIVFVDDEAMLRRWAQGLLSRLGYDVATYSSGNAALAAFQAAPYAFDAVITDQAMPGMTGAELVEGIRRIRPDMPIVLCTGYSPVMNADRARELGADAFVMKPVVTRVLAETLRALLDQRAGRPNPSLARNPEA